MATLLNGIDNSKVVYHISDTTSHFCLVFIVGDINFHVVLFTALSSRRRCSHNAASFSHLNQPCPSPADQMTSLLLCLAIKYVPFLFMVSTQKAEGRFSDTEKLLAYRAVSRSLSLDVTTPRDAYTWNYRELAALLTLSESSFESGFETLIIGSMRKNLTTESYPDLKTVYLSSLGYSAGQMYTQPGGMSNTVCLHSNASFQKFSDAADTGQYIYGQEYEVSAYSPFKRRGLHNKDAPCAVCEVETRGTQVLIVGRNICPDGWTLEYKGYLMSGGYGNKGRSAAVCVDNNAEGFPRSGKDQNGNLWYTIQASCGSLPCGPYVNGRELTCAVCTI